MSRWLFRGFGQPIKQGEVSKVDHVLAEFAHGKGEALGWSLAVKPQFIPMTILAAMLHSFFVLVNINFGNYMVRYFVSVWQSTSECTFVLNIRLPGSRTQEINRTRCFANDKTKRLLYNCTLTSQPGHFSLTFQLRADLKLCNSCYCSRL